MTVNRSSISMDSKFVLTKIQRLMVALAGGAGHSVLFVMNSDTNLCLLPELSAEVNKVVNRDVYGFNPDIQVFDINDCENAFSWTYALGEFRVNRADTIVGRRIDSMSDGQLNAIIGMLEHTSRGLSECTYLLQSNFEGLCNNYMDKRWNTYRKVKNLVDITYNYYNDEDTYGKEYTLRELSDYAKKIALGMKKHNTFNKWSTLNSANVGMTSSCELFSGNALEFLDEMKRRKVKLVARSIAYLDDCVLVHRKHLQQAYDLIV